QLLRLVASELLSKNRFRPRRLLSRWHPVLLEHARWRRLLRRAALRRLCPRRASFSGSATSVPTVGFGGTATLGCAPAMQNLRGAPIDDGRSVSPCANAIIFVSSCRNPLQRPPPSHLTCSPNTSP